MRMICITAATLALATGAFAQTPSAPRAPSQAMSPTTPPASQNGPQNQAVKGVHENNSATPVSGANSFTMAEARKQIEAKGYTRVAGLKKGKDGVWRGTATRDGKKGAVTVDYQGNVN